MKGSINFGFLGKGEIVNSASYYQLSRQNLPYLFNDSHIYIYIYIYIIYIYIYIYVIFGQVKPEFGVIPSGQENHSRAEHLNFPGRELNVIYYRAIFL